MPRPITMRGSYRDDAGYLIRLEAADMKDDRHQPAWCKLVTQKARELAVLFLEENKYLIKPDKEIPLDAPAGKRSLKP